jgi:hypothetical protein
MKLSRLNCHLHPFPKSAGIRQRKDRSLAAIHRPVGIIKGSSVKRCADAFEPSRIWSGEVPVLKNSQHEAFARALAIGRSLTQAYIASYPMSSEAAARSSSSTLLAKPNIANRVEELKEGMARRTATTAESIKDKLEHAQAFAIARGNPSALVQAIMTEARVFGLVKTKTELSGPGGEPIPIDVSSLTDEQLDQALALAAALGLLAAGPVSTGAGDPKAIEAL